MSISANNLVWFFFTLSQISTLANGLRPILPISEIDGDLWLYFSAIFMALSAAVLAQRRHIFVSITRRLISSQLPLLAALMVSFLLNAEDIFSSITNGKPAIEKVLVAAFVYSWILAFSVFVSLLLDQSGVHRGIDRISSAFVVVGTLSFVLSAIELASWFVPALRAIWVDFRSLYSIRPHGELARLSGLAFEPSYFGAVQLSSIPWIIFRFSQTRKLRYFSLVAGMAIMAVIAGSRTLQIGFASLLGVYVILLLPQGIKMLTLSAVVGCFLVAGPMLPGNLAKNIGLHSSVSDVTRARFSHAAISAGVHNPLGYGPGQANAEALSRLGGGGYQNWETRAYFSGTKGNELPPVYSLFSRLVAEIGIVGYSFIAVILFFAIARAGIFAFSRFGRSGLGGLLYLNVAATFGVGISTETMKYFSFWSIFLLLSVFQAMYGQRPHGR